MTVHHNLNGEIDGCSVRRLHVRSRTPFDTMFVCYLYLTQWDSGNANNKTIIHLCGNEGSGQKDSTQ